MDSYLGKGGLPPPPTNVRKVKKSLFKNADVNFPRNGKKGKISLKMHKMIKISKIFRLRRLSAPQASLLFNYKGLIFLFLRRKTQNFSFFAPAAQNFCHTKFFSIGSPPRTIFLTMRLAMRVRY